MAKIIPKIGSGIRGFDIQTQGPTGSFVGIVLDIEDRFDEPTPKFDDPSIIENKDVCTWCFAYKDKETDSAHLVSTYSMTQSGSPRSALYKLVSQIKGGLETNPFNGDWDYCTMVGTPCQITVASKISKSGRSYNYVASVAPLLSELHDHVKGLELTEVPGGRRTPLISTAESAESADASSTATSNGTSETADEKSDDTNPFN